MSHWGVVRYLMRMKNWMLLFAFASLCGASVVSAEDCFIKMSEKRNERLRRGWGTVQIERELTVRFSKIADAQWASEALLEEAFSSPSFDVDGGDPNERVSREQRIVVKDPTTNEFRRLKFFKNEDGTRTAQFMFRFPAFGLGEPSEWGLAGVTQIEEFPSGVNTAKGSGGYGVPDHRYFSLPSVISKACFE
jgi:hypothetical protein